MNNNKNNYSFIQNNLEKAYRLVDVLVFINTDDYIKGTLALKGGTAINQLYFNFPRISYDIDLDYTKLLSKEEIAKEKEKIETRIISFMRKQGYIVANKGKNTHILTSLVFSYRTNSGSNDNIKLDINYIDRCHIFPLAYRKLTNRIFNIDTPILTLDFNELFGSKLNALLSRGTPRDLYDINNLLNNNEIKYDLNEIVDCYIFYSLVSRNFNPITPNFSFIEQITYHKFKTQLKPQLPLDENFDVNSVRENTIIKLKEVIKPNNKRNKFIKSFINGIYKPCILFNTKKASADLDKHPMANWIVNNL